MEASGLNQWKIGDVTITRVVESEGPRDGTFILPNGTAENVQKESDWLYPAFSDQNGKLRMAIQALVIESQGKRIIVDTCIGNDKVRSNPEWNKLQLPFLQDLEKIGCPREASGRVICTHLHIDHVKAGTLSLRTASGADVPERQIPDRWHRMGFLFARGRPVPEGSGRRLGSSGDGRGDVGTGRR